MNPQHHGLRAWALALLFTISLLLVTVVPAAASPAPLHVKSKSIVPLVTYNQCMTLFGNFTVVDAVTAEFKGSVFNYCGSDVTNAKLYVQYSITCAIGGKTTPSTIQAVQSPLADSSRWYFDNYADGQCNQYDSYGNCISYSFTLTAVYQVRSGRDGLGESVGSPALKKSVNLAGSC